MFARCPCWAFLPFDWPRASASSPRPFLVWAPLLHPNLDPSGPKAIVNVAALRSRNGAQPGSTMSEDHRTKHIAVRFTEDDLAWLNEQAEDEGVGPPTLVRMIVARLRKGRAPLVSMMSAAPMAPRMVSQAPRLNYEATPMYEPVEPEGDP